MADAQSTVYNFVLPEVGASEDTWGTKNNADWSALDALLAGVFLDGGPSTLGRGMVFAATVPEVRFHDTSEVPPLGMFRFIGQGTAWELQRAEESDWSNSTALMQANSGNQYITFPQGLHIEGRAGGLADGENGHILFDALNDNGSFDFSIINVPNASTQATRMWRDVNPSADYSFLLLSPGSTVVQHGFYSDGSAYIRGPLTLGNLGGIVGETQVVTNRNDLSKHIDLHGGTVGLSVTSAGSMNLVVEPTGFLFVSDGVSNSRARFDPNGTVASSTVTVMTREKADARYVLK